MRGFLGGVYLLSSLPDDKPTFHHNNGSSESKIDDILYSIPHFSDIKIQFYEQLIMPERLSGQPLIS